MYLLVGVLLPPTTHTTTIHHHTHSFTSPLTLPVPSACNADSVAVIASSETILPPDCCRAASNSFNNPSIFFVV
jgi:hypothetical protein